MSRNRKGKQPQQTPKAEEQPRYMQPSMPEAEPVNREQIVALGSEAATLLSSPVFNDAYAATMDAIVEQWMISTDPTEREQLWLQVQNLAEVTRHLLSHVNAAQSVHLSEQEQAEQDLNAYQDEQGFH